MDGNLDRTEDGYEARFERVLDHPVETVWEALSEPEHLKEWLDVVEFEDEPGGAFVTAHGHGDELVEDRILRIEPPHLLEHTWWEDVNPDGIVRWTLESHPKGCLLTLTYTAPPESSDDWARDMAGWHIMIDCLASYLEGVPINEHEPPSADSSGEMTGGTGVYEQFNDRRSQYGEVVDAVDDQ